MTTFLARFCRAPRPLEGGPSTQVAIHRADGRTLT
jgi:hypothetical protein